MKNFTPLFLILFFTIYCKGQNLEFPKLIDEIPDNSELYFSGNLENEFHNEYTYYKKSTTKDSRSKNDKDDIKNKLLPWEILKQYNPHDFFNQVTNSINIKDLDDNRISIGIYYDLTAEQIYNYHNSIGIRTEAHISDLLKFNVISTDLIDILTNKKVEFKDQWISFCCTLFPRDNPTKYNLSYINSLKNVNFNNLKGKITIQLELPVAYEVIEITKNDIDKIIEVSENQKIKLIEFDDNKVHFELLNGVEFKSEIEFVNVSSTKNSIFMAKYLYAFFRSRPNMNYSQFEKRYNQFIEKKEEKLEENLVYVYTLKSEPDKFYIYSPRKESMLKKEITLNIN